MTKIFCQNISKKQNKKQMKTLIFITQLAICMFFYSSANSQCHEPTNYSMKFESTDDYSDWTFLDANNDGYIWGLYNVNETVSAGYLYNSLSAADDYLFSPCFLLEVGKTYELSFSYATASSGSYMEKLRVLYGTSNNETIENLIVDLGEFAHQEFVRSTSLITVTETNNYYFGWHCYSDADKWAVYVDSIVIREVQENQQSLATVSTLEVSSILQNSAVVGGNISDMGSSDIIERGIVWSTLPNPVIGSSEYYTNTGATIGEYISLLSGLTSNTTYYIRAYATNSAGTAYGNEKIFTTLEDAPTTIIAENEPNNNVGQANQIPLNSQLSGEIGVDVDHYDWFTFTTEYEGAISFTASADNTLALHLKLFNQNGSTVLREVFTENLGETVSLSFDNLMSGTYYLEVSRRTVNVSPSFGSYSIETVFTPTTLFDQKDNEPNNSAGEAQQIAVNTLTAGQIGYSNGLSADHYDWFTFTLTSENSITIFGNPDEMLAMKISLYQSNGVTVLQSAQSLFKGDSIRLFYENLPAETYYIQITRELIAGVYTFGSYSFELIYGSGIDLPTITTNEVLNVSYNRALVQGTILSDGGGNIQGFGFCWNTEPSPTLEHNHLLIGGGSLLGTYEAYIHDLNPNTTYYVRTYATNEEGITYGNELSFTTKNPMILVYNTELGEGTTITMRFHPGWYGIIDALIDWGDGSTETVTTAQTIHHTYAQEGIYTVIIDGILGGFGHFDNLENAEKLISVTSFGEIGLNDVSGAFRGAINLTEVPAEIPSSLTNISNMFNGATSFNGDISTWNTSNITFMISLFYNATAFNQDIGNWDVSNVTLMDRAFYNASSFNQDISAWNVSGIEDMYQLFHGASSFNQDISSWDVSNVKRMEEMFKEAVSFNQDISGWNVQNVTNMMHMFYGASSFNQDISSWNVSNVTTMNNMFREASVFNQDISSWNTTSLTNTIQMFFKASSFNQDISSWDFSQTTTMISMFDESAITRDNYDKLLISLASQNLQNNVSLGLGTCQYSGGEPAEARQFIIDTYNWTIQDGGEFIEGPFYKIYPSYISYQGIGPGALQSMTQNSNIIGYGDSVVHGTTITFTATAPQNATIEKWEVNDIIITNNDATIFTGSVFILENISENYTVKVYFIEVSEFGGGSGTEADPWKIYTAEQLDAVRNYQGSNNSDKHFVLMNDIDVSNYISEGNPGYNDGSYWSPIGTLFQPFYGTFDGNGFEIRNIKSTNISYVGLFGYVENPAVIQNIGVIIDPDGAITGTSANGYVGGLVGMCYGCSISDSYVIGTVVSEEGSNVGGLVGGVTQNGTISNSYTQGSVSGVDQVGGLAGRTSQAHITNSYSSMTVDGNSMVGGLIGEMWHGTTSNSYASGEVTAKEEYSGGFVGIHKYGTISNSFASGDVYGKKHVGGFVGENYGFTASALIEDSYALGRVTGIDNVGGFAGTNNEASIERAYARGRAYGDNQIGGFVGQNSGGTIDQAYSTGSVSGISNSGGFAGENRWSGVITNAFWDITASQMGISDGGVALETHEIKNPSSLPNWDFSGVWLIDESINDGYPSFMWQEQITTYIGALDTKNNTLRVYPNPTQLYVTIQNVSEGAVLWISDMQGKTVVGPTTEHTISISHLANGVYTVHILNKLTTTERIQFIKQ